MKKILLLLTIIFLTGCTSTAISVDDGVLRNEAGTEVGTPTAPLHVDQGGFLYGSDINFAESDFGNFTGDTMDLFTDLNAGIIDNTSNPTKSLTIQLKVPAQIAFVGLGCSIPGKNFSNIKIELLGSGQPPAVILTIDQSNIDTKLTSKVPQTNPRFMTGIRLTFSTTDEICLTNINLQKIQTVNAKTDYSTLNVNEHYTDFDSAISTLTSTALPGDTSLNITDTTGFSVGDSIIITENGRTEIDDMEITAINTITDILTLDRPLDNSYNIGSEVERVVINMAVVGSLTNPIIYEICANKGEIINIDRNLFSMLLSTSPDDSRFGNIAGGLTNGLVMRTNVSGKTRLIDNWKTNGDLRLTMYDVAEIPKAGGGNFGLGGRYTFTAHRFSAQLNGENGDCLQILVQDDLSSLLYLSFKGEGQVITN